MECEFCNTDLTAEEPENVALLQHLETSEPCHEQYGYLLDNISSSWVRSCSGGA